MPNTSLHRYLRRGLWACSLCVLGLEANHVWASPLAFTTANLLATMGNFPREMVRMTWADGSEHLVFANGSDIAPAPLTAFNIGTWFSGGAPALPNWYSNTGLYDSGLAQGDLDGDGLADLLVSSLADPTQSFVTGGIRVHWGTQSGLEQEPSWLVGGPAHDGFAASDVAVGDLDGDGDLDIAIGVVWEGNRSNTARSQEIGNQSELVGIPLGLFGKYTDKNCTNGGGGFSSDGLSCLNGRPRIYLNQGKRAFVDSKWRAAPSANGANTVLLQDFNNDGWLDMALGSPQIVVYYGNSTGKFNTLPDWAAGITNAFTYDMIPLYSGANHAPFIVSSAGCVVPDGCEISQNGYQGFAVAHDNTSPLFKMNAGLWTGDQELAAAIAAGDLNNDGSQDLLGSMWTSAAGSRFGGSPVALFEDILSSDGFFSTSNPNALPGTSLLPMGADILVGRLCAAPNTTPLLQSVKVSEPRSIFALNTSTVDAITGVTLTLVSGKTVAVPRATVGHCGIKNLPCFTTGGDGTWVSLSPPVDSSNVSAVNISYLQTLNPDVAVANSDPDGYSGIWCNTNKP